MKKGLSIMAMLVIVMAIAIGCSSKQSTTTDSIKNDGSQALTVNKDKKEVRIQAEVNGKYFTEATRHGVVYKGGTNGEKSVLRGLVDEKKLYDALLSLGAKPGNNVKATDTGKNVKIEGTKLNVTVTWDGLGKEIPFSDIITSSEPRPMDIRFGGNIKTATAKNTGCILCLDSCPVGITSNAAYAFGESSKIKFYGNKNVLPKDGTKVTVIFTLAK